MADEFEVEQNPDGTFDVRQNRRSIGYDIEDWELPALLRRYKATGYTLIHLDGFRERVGV